MCRIHCIRSFAKSQSIHSTSNRAAVVWCILGVFLIVYIQHKCDGKGGNQTGRESRRFGGTQAKFGRICQGYAKIEFTGKTGVSEHT